MIYFFCLADTSDTFAPFLFCFLATYPAIMLWVLRYVYVILIIRIIYVDTHIDKLIIWLYGYDNALAVATSTDC